MREEIINYKDYTLQRVSKTHAKKLVLKDGARVFTKPCKINAQSPICIMYIIDPVKLTDFNRSFDSLVNEIEYYNCNSEEGKYLSYYVECEVK